MKATEFEKKISQFYLNLLSSFKQKNWEIFSNFSGHLTISALYHEKKTKAISVKAVNIAFSITIVAFLLNRLWK